MTSLLEVRDLGVTYRGRGRRKDKIALDGVSITIEAGETLGLVGESGSGKSTLGGCVLGLVHPARGRIVFDGRDVTHLSSRDRRALSAHIQAVFQDPYSSFNPHRTIEQTVGETLTNERDLSRAARRSRIVEMLERVGLDQSALEKFPAQFSGGQRQRIAIARALLPDPRLVVCDESVSALDLSVQAQVLNLLLELQRERGVAYLFITHDLSVVKHMSNRIAVLEHGRLVEDGEAGQVTEHPAQPYTRRLITASPQADPDVQDARRAVRKAMARAVAEDVADRGAHRALLLHALEKQAVAEALAQPGGRVAVLEAAVARFADDTHDVTRLMALRASITELSARTSAAMTSAAVLGLVEQAREDICGALIATCEATDFAGRCTDLASAIASGARDRALMLVESMGSTWIGTTEREVEKA
jgi:ABC-type oligopeptide transport system ATPase subunit